jgi:hypothetical protein
MTEGAAVLAREGAAGVAGPRWRASGGRRRREHNVAAR